jgi:histidine ammonia-lyase
VLVLERYDQLDLDSYWLVVHRREPVAIDPVLLSRVEAGRRTMLEHLAGGAAAYGVTTGLGYLRSRPIAAEDELPLQRSILVGRASGVGPALGDEVVRGAMLLRLTGFLSGRAGVSADLCRFIADRLNDGFSPIVPASRPGTAGETIPLCHLFQTFIGEGEVRDEEGHVPAADALARRGAAPYELQPREGLALVNGAPLAPAEAVFLAFRAAALLEHATLLGALAAALIGASSRPYSPRVGRLKGDPGQQRVHTQLGELLGDHDRFADGAQPPVSFRVLPQVHGAAADVLAQLESRLERELGAVTDSPLWLEADGDEPQGFYPSGNFHSQGLALALDALAIAFTQVAALSEKRLHRLLDSRFSGLPEQLSPDPDRGQCGLVSLHKAVVGLCAENRLLAAPASIHASDTSSGQEDFQAFTGLAADKLGRLLDNLELTLAYELLALRQAHDLGGATLPPALASAMNATAAVLDAVGCDRSLAPDVERARELIRTGTLPAAAAAAPTAASPEGAPTLRRPPAGGNG